MNCQEARALVEDVLDRRLFGSAKRRFDLHISRCSECRAYCSAEQAEHARWFRALNFSGGPKRTLPSDFADRLVAAVQGKDSARKGFWSRFRIPRWVGVAAALAIVFMSAAMVTAVISSDGAEELAEESRVQTSSSVESSATGVISTQEEIAVSSVLPVSGVTETTSGDSVTTGVGVAESANTETKGEKVGILSSIKRAGAAILGITALTTAADETYQFIVSGYPAADEKSSFTTAGIALDTGTYRYCIAETGLEARYRSIFATPGVKLNSYEFKAMMITIR